MDVFLFDLFQALLALVALTLQCTTLPLFLLFADYRSRISHRQMFCIGLFDSFEAMPIFVCTLCAALGLQMPKWAEKVCCALFILAWDVLVMQHFVLALNRAITIVRAYLYPADPEPHWERPLFTALSALVWAYLLATMALFQTPLIGGQFDPSTGLILFDMALPYTQLYQSYEFYLTLAVPGVSFCFYLAIIIALKKNRSRCQTGQGVAPLMSAQERRVLISAGILFTGMLFIIFIWFFMTSLPDQARQIIVLSCICYYGANPLLYLTLNSEFRDRFLKLYGFRNMSAIVTPAKVVVVKSSTLLNRTTSPHLAK